MKCTRRIRLTIAFLVAFATFDSATAQLCQGSLGDPVVNITFGSGPNFGPPLSGSITTYSYVASSCPNDGSYTIGNSTSGCFTNSWHTATEDHTPNDVNGYMMIANASYSPSDFYVDTISGLCSGVTYEFAAWLSNVQRGSSCNGSPGPPNVTFNIETTSGTVLLSNNTGNIPFENTVAWKQYGAFFTMPANTTRVVIRMRNNAPGGCANDLLLDDITFRPCGALVSATIEGANNTEELCFGEKRSFTFKGEVQTQNNLLHQWQSSADSGATWQDIAGANTNSFKSPEISRLGRYSYRLSVSTGSGNSISSCRVVSNVLTINVNPLPVPTASNDGPVCEGKTLTITASGASTYSWTGPQNFTANISAVSIPVIKTGNSGTYYVTATSDKSCKSIDSTLVIVDEAIAVDAGVNSEDICEGKNIQLRGSGTAGAQFLWSPSTALSAGNIAQPIASPVDTTVYILTVSNGGCSASDTTTINVLKKPVADAGPDKEILQGESTVLSGLAQGSDVSYFWTPNRYISNPSVLQPAVSPAGDTTFTLNVTSNRGCGSSTDNVTVKVFKTITIPNAFSPNGDGINDRWQISQIALYPQAQISVFNRYGQSVYTSKGNYTPWDGTYKGKTLPTGTYYYVIDLKVRALRYAGWVFIVQ